MTDLMQHMQLALRERRRTVLLFGIWILLTLVCAVSGPFGTHGALPFILRVGYWSIVVGASVSSSMLPIMLRDHMGWTQLVVWAVYVLCLSVLIFGLNALVFPSWTDPTEFAYLLIRVGFIVCVVHMVLWLINYARPIVIQPDIDPQTRFLRRIPLVSRGPLVRIEAQDYYLNVVTTRGTTLILMRLSEAVEELHGSAGILVHRSHWVALPAVKAHRRDKGRDILVMSDGVEVPVSRSNGVAAQEAGLF